MRDLIVEMAARIADDRIDAGFQPDQRGYVAEFGPRLDEAVDNGASGLNFALDRCACGIKASSDRRELVVA